MNLGEVLGKPFKYIGKNIFLWALGMIALIIPTVVSFLAYFFLITNMETFQSLMQNAQLYSYRPDLLDQAFGNLQPELILPTILTIFGVVMLAVVVSWLITEYITCCIIGGTRLADTAPERVLFKEVLREGWKSFGKLLLQDLLWMVATGVLFTGMIFILTGFQWSESSTGALVAVLCCLGCLVLPVWFFVSILFAQIRTSLVHDNLGVFSSMEKGWKTYIKAFGWFLLLGLILGVGQLIPRSMLNFSESRVFNVTGVYALYQNTSSSKITQIIIAAIFALVGFLLNSFFFTYETSAWTMAYRNVHSVPFAVAIPPALPPIPVVETAAKTPRKIGKPYPPDAKTPVKGPRKTKKPPATSG